MLSLHAKTLQLLENRRKKQTYAVMAEETGLSMWFIVNFSYKKLKSPSVDNVQCLYEYLSGKKLEV